MNTTFLPHADARNANQLRNSGWGLLAFGAGSLKPLGPVAGLVLTTALTVGMYVSKWTDDSSTAALGFLGLPLYHGLATGAVIAFQRLRDRNATV